MSDNNIIVFFDLEATGLDTTICDIIQLSAICGDRTFNVYTLPRRPLTDSAKQVTGFSVSGDTLFLRGTRVNTTPVNEALSSFIAFLRSFRRPVQLAAHSAKRFDAPVIRRVLKQHSLWQEFLQVVTGFVDTFLLSKDFCHGVTSYSQQNLVRHYLGERYNAHNATEDARMLQKLYKKWNPSKWVVSRCSFTPTSSFY